MGTLHIRAFDGAGLSSNAQLNIATNRSLQATASGTVTDGIFVTVSGSVLAPSVSTLSLRAFDGAGLSAPISLQIERAGSQLQLTAGGTVLAVGSVQASVSGQIASPSYVLSLRAFDAAGLSAPATLHLYSSRVEIQASGTVQATNSIQSSVAGTIRASNSAQATASGTVLIIGTLRLRFEVTGETSVFRTIFSTTIPRIVSATSSGTVYGATPTSASVSGYVAVRNQVSETTSGTVALRSTVSFGASGSVANSTAVSSPVSGTVAIRNSVSGTASGFAGVASSQSSAISGSIANNNLVFGTASGVVRASANVSVLAAGSVSSASSSTTTVSGFVQSGQTVSSSVLGFVQDRLSTSSDASGSIQSSNSSQLFASGLIIADRSISFSVSGLVQLSGVETSTSLSGTVRATNSTSASAGGYVQILPGTVQVLVNGFVLAEGIRLLTALGYIQDSDAIQASVSGSVRTTEHIDSVANGYIQLTRQLSATARGHVFVSHSASLEAFGWVQDRNATQAESSGFIALRGSIQLPVGGHVLKHGSVNTLFGGAIQASNYVDLRARGTVLIRPSIHITPVGFVGEIGTLSTGVSGWISLTDSERAEVLNASGTVVVVNAVTPIAVPVRIFLTDSSRTPIPGAYVQIFTASGRLIEAASTALNGSAVFSLLGSKTGTRYEVRCSLPGMNLGGPRTISVLNPCIPPKTNDFNLIVTG